MGTVTGALGLATGGMIGSKPTAPQTQTTPIDKDKFKLHYDTEGTKRGGYILGQEAHKRKRELEGQAAKLRQHASTDRANQLAARRSQTSNLAALQAQAEGRGPSLATAQLKAAQDRGLRQQLATAASSRGVNPAALQRSLAYSQGDQNAQLAQQAAKLRLQEQLEARKMVGSAAGQLRESDLAAIAAGTQAQQVNLQGLTQADQAALAAPAFALEIARAEQAAASDPERLRIQQHMGLAGANLQAQSATQAANQAAAGGLMSGALSAGGMLGAAAMRSDERTKKSEKIATPDFVEKKTKEVSNKVKKAAGLKTDKPIDKDKLNQAKEFGDTIKKATSAGYEKASQTLREGGSGGGDLFRKSLAEVSDEKTKNTKDFNPEKFLNAIQAHKFEYKDEFKNDPGAGNGTYLGVMAQELEKAGPVGKSMVQQSPEGYKQVDFGKGFGAILASQAHLNKRLQALESKKKKGKK